MSRNTASRQCFKANRIDKSAYTFYNSSGLTSLYVDSCLSNSYLHNTCAVPILQTSYGEVEPT
jgi:hypothetical protein